MNRCRRITALILAIIALLTLIPFTALASVKVEPIKYNSWYSLKDYDYSGNYTLYKITVSTNMLLNFQVKNKKDAKEIYVRVFADKDCDEEIRNMSYNLGTHGIDGVALYKGTYYLRMFDDNAKSQIKITKTKINNINKPNYTPSKAIQMTKNTRYEFIQTNKENYNRWYKIKLTKSQVINIYGEVMDDWNYGFYRLYDNNMNEIKCKFSYEKQMIKTIGKQKKGTYYLMFDWEGFDTVGEQGRYYRIYWE